jgi:hypothetical protein
VVKKSLKNAGQCSIKAGVKFLGLVDSGSPVYDA